MIERGDTKFAQYKIAFVQYLTLAVFLFLATGFWRLQIQQPDYYAGLAEQNRVKSLPLLAPRGRITDREGRTIVANYPSFSILLLRAQMKDAEAHLALIADGLEIPLPELQARLRKFRSAPKYQPIIVKEDANAHDLAFLEAHRDDLPELEPVMVQRRLYPRDGFAAHVIGYVGEVSESELDSAEFAAYEPGAIVGKSGLERQYNDILMGQDGLRRAVVDSRGREVGRLDEKAATPGKPLRLTLDLDLQTAAEVAMDGKTGAVVALDPRSGEVLVMVSRPAYNPNKFAVRISGAEWKELIDDPDKPLLNRAIQAQLAPGSVYKVFLATSILEAEAVKPTTVFGCGGGATFYGRFFRCHSTHGSVSLHRAIVQSCDVYFYNAGQRLGIDKMAYYSQHFGLGSRTGIDMPNEEEGVMPSPEWKQRMFREKWYAGETISVAIGQGSVQITPLQMAYAVGGIASGGVFRRPHLVFPSDVRGFRPDSKLDEVREFPLKNETVELVTAGMYGVVNEGGGTGGRARIQGVDVGGKTGTAQVGSLELTMKTNVKYLKDNAWFVGTAPRRNPEIVVACLLQHGGHGSSAAPVVREVIQVYWNKRKTFKRPEFAGDPAGKSQPHAGAKPKTVPGAAKPAPSTGEQPRQTAVLVVPR